MTSAPDSLLSDDDYKPAMPQRKEVGIGCVGAGFIMADCHLVAYRQASFNPVAICSRTRTRAEEAASRHSIETVYDDYEGLLEDRRVEVLDIAVPPDLQIDVIRQAVGHNDHIRGILAQKPLGMHYAQAVEMVSLQRRFQLTSVRKPSTYPAWERADHSCDLYHVPSCRTCIC